jgi:hypothetical protein
MEACYYLISIHRALEENVVRKEMLEALGPRVQLEPLDPWVLQDLKDTPDQLDFQEIQACLEQQE